MSISNVWRLLKILLSAVSKGTLLSTGTILKLLQNLATGSITRLLLPGAFTKIAVLSVVSLALMVQVSLLCAVNRLSSALAQCQSGLTDAEKLDGQLLETRPANYNPPPYRHGSNGSGSLVIFASARSLFSPMNTSSTMVSGSSSWNLYS